MQSTSLNRAPRCIQIANTWLIVNIGAARPRQAVGNARRPRRFGQDQQLMNVRGRIFNRAMNLEKVEVSGHPIDTLECHTPLTAKLAQP